MVMLQPLGFSSQHLAHDSRSSCTFRALVSVDCGCGSVGGEAKKPQLITLLPNGSPAVEDENPSQWPIAASSLCGALSL